jgi:hypothetical protein
MKPAKAGGWLPHEIAFAVFFTITAARSFAAGHEGILWGCIFSGLTGLVVFLRSLGEPQIKWRLWPYVLLMLIAYRACGFAVPIFHPGATFLLANADRWFLGNDAAHFLEPWTKPPLTDLFYGLYLFFFVYIAISLWHYGRGDLKTFRRFIAGLFTVYAVGFLGYTLLPAGGPYLEIPEHFSTPLAGSEITNVCTAAVRWGSNRVDCFPCLHFAVSFFILVFDYWHCRRRFYWLALPCVGIWISTIYLRQHYFVDLLGGLILAVCALWLVKPEPATTADIEASDAA